MGSINRKYLIVICSIIFVSLFTQLACDRKGKGGEKPFDYGKIIRDEYRIKVGKVVPLTIEQSIEIDGELSRDGMYFFYSSDRERGNFDIYLRALDDITTVRITQHPSKDTSPAISPDGDYLAFVSQREDPEGDIYVVNIKSARLIEKAEESVLELPSLDKEAVNVTLYQDPVTKTVKIIKDDSPCWSPDGKWIAFSSTRGGTENIWIMDRKGGKLRRVTEKGGMYPRFSENGEQIIFISYRDTDQNGEVYVVNLKSGRERRLTDSKSIELYPTFMGNNQEIIYTLIDRDTNANGKLDLKDNSVLFYKNLKTGLEYPLTLYSQSSFTPRWSPLFAARDVGYQGVVVYSDQIGENININVVPEYGIIPKRENAQRQYDLAARYMKEYDDIERYVLCLERVYHFFGASKSSESIIFVSKGLIEAAKLYYEFGYAKEARDIQRLLSSLSAEKTDYRNVAAEYLKVIFSGKAGDGIFRTALDQMKSEKAKREFIPYMMEDLGDEYQRQGNDRVALEVFQKLLREYPKYRRSVFVNYKMGLLTYRKLEESIAPFYLKVLETRYVYQINDTIINLIKVFEEEGDIKKRISISRKMLKKYTENRYLPGLLQYVIGKSSYERGDIKSAKEHLTQSLKVVRKSDLIFYKSNVLLGRIAESEKRLIDMEKYYALAANGYVHRWNQKDVREISKKLIGYYEEYGKRSEQAGDYNTAVNLYKKYVDLVTYLYAIKRFEDIYSEYGSRAHILYIDAFAALKGNRNEGLEQLRKKYMARMAIARLSFEKAHIYGLGYLYAKMALNYTDEESPLLGGDITDVLNYFRMSIEQINWALFIDDTFIDPYLLKGWIYQYVDLMRNEDLKETGGRNERKIGGYFSRYLWEANIPLYERALSVNDETRNPGSEGNLYLNIANTYFLLSNYPRALFNYERAQQFKRRFDSHIEEALFHFHFGYCYWQNGDYEKARDEMNRTLFIYQTIASDKNIKRYRHQFYYLYRYFALFNRVQKRYRDAIDWYNRMLEFSNTYQIKIDRARYLQEIAFCYKELGEVDRALVYLDRARRALRGYEDVERKYPVKLKLLGFIPIPIWNLGPDAAVIGENKIYYELDTYNKKLLNISLQESIFYEASNYTKAISYLEKKLELLSERDYEVNHEGIIRTLNNIGYCNFKLHHYTDAFKYFQKAWDHAADPDVNNLDGIFRSVMNVANLFVFSLENEIALSTDPLKDSSDLIEKISEYRDSYEKNRLMAELETLKEKAEKEKRKLRDEEIRETKERIAKDAENIYYTLDITMGILKYCQAELLFKSSPMPEGGILNAYEVYTENRRTYDLYAEARTIFERSLEKAKERQSKRLLVKLLMNLGSCQKRTAYFDEAYDSFLQAEEIAQKYEYHDLIWEVYYNLARFISEYGDAVEGRDYRSIAERYYVQAIEGIERFPVLNGGDIHRVKKVYSEYVRFLIKRGKARRAFIISENQYATVRSILIFFAAPEFFDESDNRDYRNFRKIVNDINETRQEITRLLESEGNSEKIADLRKTISNNLAQLNDIRRDLKRRNSYLSSYLSVGPVNIPGYRDIVIYKFLDVNGEMYSWRIISGKIEFESVDIKKTSPPDAIMKYLSRDSATGRRLILLNDTFLKSLSENISVQDSIPYMLVPSLDRIPNYLSYRNQVMREVYCSTDKLRDELSDNNNLADLTFRGGDIHPSDHIFSIIIEDTQRGKISHSLLFSKRIEPTLLFKRMSFNSDDICLAIESSLYSGIKSLILYRDVDASGLSSILESAYQRSYDYLNPDKKFSGKVIAVGFHGFDKEKRMARLSEEEGKIFQQYKSALDGGKYTLARMYLKRWFDINPTVLERKLSYLLMIAELDYLRENYERAIDFLSDAVKLSLGKYPKAHIRAVANLIYLKIYTGNISDARTLVQKYEKDAGLENTRDIMFFKSMISLLTETIETSNRYYQRSKKYRLSLVPENRLKLLYAEYLNLFGRARTVKEILSEWKQDYPVSEREALKIIQLTGSQRGVRIPSRRAQDIVSTPSIDEEDDTARFDYFASDTLSIFPLMLSLDELMMRNRYDAVNSLIGHINLNEFVEYSDWKDISSLLTLMYSLQQSTGNFQKAVEMVKLRISIFEKKEVPALLRKALYEYSAVLLQMKDYQKSYEIAKRGYALFRSEDELSVKYQMHLMENEIFLGKIKDAMQRGSRIEGKLKNAQRYVFYLLKSQIERQVLIKRYSVEKRRPSRKELEKYQNLVLKAISILDESPDVLHENNRLDLIKRGLDFIISYELSLGNVHQSLMYVEMKKQLVMRSTYPALLRRDVSKERINEFKKITDARDSERFIALLRKYPLLYVGATIRILPVEDFQKILPKNSVVLYMVANEDDIFVWVIDEKRFVARRFAKGYLQVQKIISQYNDAASQLSSTVSMSQELEELFKSLKGFYTGKQLIIFITDNELESVPFEILGKRDLLGESHTIVYLTSILSALRKYNSGRRMVEIVGGDTRQLYHELETVAVRESGIPYRISGTVTSDIGHLHDTILFNPVKGTYFLKETEYLQVVRSPEIVYIPAVRFGAQGDYNGFSIYNSFNGIRTVIINDAKIHDINNAIFVETLYREIKKGSSSIAACERARQAVRENERYEHPSYWAGIRIYLNGF